MYSTVQNFCVVLSEGGEKVVFLVDEAQMAYKQPDVDAAIWGYCKFLTGFGVSIDPSENLSCSD